MPFAQAAYLTIVVCGFVLFIVTLGIVSLTAAPPWRRGEPAGRKEAETNALGFSPVDKHAA